MKQVVQTINTGELMVSDVPAPKVRARGVLVHTAASLVSAGTERMIVDFAEKNLIEKARARPDLVRQTIDKAQRDGILTTIEAVRNQLDLPVALGYSCVGTVIDVGHDAGDFQVGDRVACAGGGYAAHAEIVSVPRTLVVKLPDNVDWEAAAFTTLGAIALQGIRLAEVKLGEVVGVIGLGLLGQLAVQMLKAAGCVVIGMDIQAERADLARELGADLVATSREQFVGLCQQVSGGHGADAVVITADTRSNEPVEVAGEAARDRGIVAAVGAVGMTIPRKIYYEKELDFRISRSYGPGRYDPEYEDKGNDYPYGYVRWTEQRNMQAFVQLLSEGKLRVHPVITHRFPIADAARAYEVILGKTGQPFLGVLMTYPESPDLRRKIQVHPSSATGGQPASNGTRVVNDVRLGFLGAGNFANATLLPALKNVDGIKLVGITSSGGLTARSTADRFAFDYCATDSDEILKDPTINTVVILTRHHLHARQIIAALAAGKHVFVEKPLCLNQAELDAIVAAREATLARALAEGTSPPTIMIGFNRRFAPFVVELKQHLKRLQEPLMLNFRVNAGFIPASHWLHDPAQGGGRLLGEGCHFIDLLLYLANSPLRHVTTRMLPDSGRYSQDNLLITLEFADGSLGTVTYVANGDKGFGKEYLEVFGSGLAARIDDYRTLTIRHRGERTNRVARLRQDKGHHAEWQTLAAHLTGKGPAPIPFTDIIQSTEATFAALRSLETNATITLGGD